MINDDSLVERSQWIMTLFSNPNLMFFFTFQHCLLAVVFSTELWSANQSMIENFQQTRRFTPCMCVFADIFDDDQIVCPGRRENKYTHC